MIKYYVLLFLRNLMRHKLFSGIILLGLTVSMVSTMLIYLYVRHEFSFDRFHKNADRIYRVNQTFIWGENSNLQFSSTGPGVAYALKEELPEVEMITSIHTPGNFIVSYTKPSKEIVAFEEERIFAGDTNFFKMFNFPFIKGDPESALREANTLVLTESTAKKYFGGEDPIGKLVRLGSLKGEDQTAYEVTGVIKDTPDNSYIEFDILISLTGFHLEKRSWSWVWTQLETYVLLDERANITNVREKLTTIPRKRAAETLRIVMNTTYDEYIKSGKKWELFLQPMTGIHLPDVPITNRLNDTGNIQILYSLIGAAFFIVLLSCVNFMNLSTAQFTRRIKEASVRKILGLGRKELSLSYFFEACAFCFIALVAALGLSQLLLPGFNIITGKSLQLNLWNDPGLIAGMLVLVLLMAIVSSSYPALFLSSFHPVEAIKGKLKIGREGKSFRNGLVVFQFSVSIILIICTAIVFQQLNYVSEKDLGFDRENLLVVKHLEGIKSSESFANAALNVPGVANSSWCNSVPPKIWGGDTFTADEMGGKKFALNFTHGDERYIPTLDIKLLIGRNFSIDNPEDVHRVIINESTVKKIGWPVDESVIGKHLEYEDVRYEVIGVVADFNYWSLQAAIEPLAIFHQKNPAPRDSENQFLTLRIKSQNSTAWETTFASLNKLWKEHAGDAPFQYEFVDEEFARTFQTQQQFGKALTIMATLAILIASLGLLAMIIYALEQRTKEIGIRKVSGASTWNILTLISKGYTKLIVVAFIIGAPISYWMMSKWLEDFAFQIKPSIWIFVLTGSGILIIAILITSYHSVKAALTNPVEVLKDE